MAASLPIKTKAQVKSRELRTRQHCEGAKHQTADTDKGTIEIEQGQEDEQRK
jgi:hypothetical protein